jgi:hypothetical protein
VTDNRSFETAFAEFTVASGRWRDTTPSELLARWSKLVSECEAGYLGDAEDYFNDLTSRDAIERAVRNEDLCRYDEMVAFKEQVARIDERFRALLEPDAFPRIPAEDWWARGVVRSAGPRLVRDLRDRYGVVIASLAEGGSSDGGE